MSISKHVNTMTEPQSPAQQPMPKIYSYRRVSSIKQTKGAGLEMQKEQEKLSELSKAFNLSISDEVLDDAGLSAFHGEHTAKGSLGWFIAAVKSGLIAKGSILVIYSLDRFSRLEIDRAVHDLTGLTSEGIMIFSILENKMFGNPKEDNEQRALSLMGAQLVFARSHNESLAKSKRAQHLLKIAMKRHLDGERSQDGYAYSIKVAGNDVWWVDNSLGDVRPRDKYWECAKEICQRLTDGESPYMIEKWLNNSDMPSPIKRIGKIIPGAWSIHIIRRIHEHRALIGEKTINGILLPNYYPPLLTEDEFYRLQDARKNRKRPKSKRTAIVSLFAGLSNVMCAHCGAGIHLNTEPSNNSYNYRCSGHRSNCDTSGVDYVPEGAKHEPKRGWTKRASLIESTLLKLSIDKVWRPIKVVRESRMPVLQAQIDMKNILISKLAKHAEEKGFPDILLARLIEMQSELNQLEEEHEQIRICEAANESKAIDSLVERWKVASESVLDFNNEKARLHMRELIRDSFEKITIGRQIGGDRYGITMNLYFADGSTRVVVLGRTGVISLSGVEKNLSSEGSAYLSSVETEKNNFYHTSSEMQQWLTNVVSDFKE